MQIEIFQMKKYSLILAIVLIFQSVNAFSGVRFLPEISCSSVYKNDKIKNNKIIKKAKNKKSICQRKDPTLVTKEEQYSGVIYEFACEDNTGLYYKSVGCHKCYIDMSKYENTKVHNCSANTLVGGRCCPKEINNFTQSKLCKYVDPSLLSEKEINSSDSYIESCNDITGKYFKKK